MKSNTLINDILVKKFWMRKREMLRKDSSQEIEGVKPRIVGSSIVATQHFTREKWVFEMCILKI